MQTKETILTGLTATTAMTAFSYAVSALAKDNFKEPPLLSRFIKQKASTPSAPPNHSGWLVHYTFGCIWAGVYAMALKKLKTVPTMGSSFSFGLFSGTLGILCWRWLFKQQPSPPRINYANFYKHLLAAHLLFAFTAAKTFRAILSNRNKKPI